MNAVRIGGDTPLHDAVVNGHKAVVAALPDAGASTDAPGTAATGAFCKYFPPNPMPNS